MSEQTKTYTKKRLAALAMVILAAAAVAFLPAPKDSAMPSVSCITTYLSADLTQIVGSRYVTCQGQIFTEGTTSSHVMSDCEPCGGGGCQSYCTAYIDGIAYYVCCT